MTLSLNKYDIVICGAGLAGLTLALQLRNQLPQHSILILEKEVGPLPDGAHKVGESMTEGGTYLLRQLAGLKEYVESTHIKKLGLRFFGAGHRQDGFEKRFEIGDTLFARNTSYQIDRGILENDLRRFCRDAGVHIEEGVSVKDIQFAEDEHTITFADPEQNKEAQVACRWVIDAMGRRRFLQSKLGLSKKSSHSASACWWRMQGDLDVAKMVAQEEIAWHDRVIPRRWYSTNHLLGPGYFIWIIPLCSNMTSIGIVADETAHPVRDRNSMQKTFTWLAEHEPSLFEFIKDEEPLDFLVLKNFAYTTTKAFSAGRWCCIGEAAAFTDPLYSMGTDLIAMGNRITVHLIELDAANALTEETVALYNKLYLKVVEVMTEIFNNMYPAFGNDDVAILKIMWDISCYWGFFSQLSIQDFLYQENLLPQLFELANRLQTANRQVQTALRTAACTPSTKTGFYQFGGVSSVTDLRAKVTDKKSIQDVEGNMEFLEQFASTLCCFVTKEELAPVEMASLMGKLTSYLTPVEHVSMAPVRG